MKKTLMAVAAMAAMCGFCGHQNDLLVTLSASEKLVYSDDRLVDNELVALVWTPAGETFGGFLADGTVKGASKVLARVLVQSGTFPKTTFQIDAKLANEMKLSQGVFSLFLLDTRGADGVAIGTKCSTGDFVGKVPVNYTAKILEGTITSEGAGSISEIKSEDAAEGVTGGKIVAEGQAELPVEEATLAPIIKSAKIEDGKFVVTIEQAVPYMGYGLSVGTTPAKADMKPVGKPVSGSTKEVVLEYPIDPNQPTAFIQATAGRNQ